MSRPSPLSRSVRGRLMEGKVGLMAAHELMRAFHNGSARITEGLCVVFCLGRPTSATVSCTAKTLSKVRSLRSESLGAGILVVNLCSDTLEGVFSLGFMALIRESGRVETKRMIVYGLGEVDKKSVHDMVKKAKHVVVVGNKQEGVRCKAISNELGIKMRVMGSEPIDATCAQLIFVPATTVTFSCAPPIPDVGLVIGHKLQGLYFDGRSGRTLFGPWIDEAEARLQASYAGQGATFVANYSRTEIRKGNLGILFGGNLPQYEAVDLIEYWGEAPIDELPLPLSIDDRMLIMETMRQFCMQGLTSLDISGVVEVRVSFPILRRMIQILAGLDQDLSHRGAQWTSVCMVALATSSKLSKEHVRIIICIAVVSCCFPIVMDVSGTNEDLVAICRGPGKRLASYGWIWLTWGLWEAVGKLVEHGDIDVKWKGKVSLFGGLVNLNLPTYVKVSKAIQALESSFECGLEAVHIRSTLSADDMMAISENLMWAGLFNLVLIPKDPARHGEPYDLASVTAVEWKRTVTCGLDVSGHHKILSPEDGETWLGVAHDFTPSSVGLGSERITIISINLLDKVEEKRGLPLERVVNSRFCHRNMDMDKPI